MGPSGCGKSTLLDILADRKDSGYVEGRIALNGVCSPAHPRPRLPWLRTPLTHAHKASAAQGVRASGRPLDKYYRRVSAYVMQSDVLFPNLTVRETLMFAAQLRLTASTSDAEKFQRVCRMRTCDGLGRP